MQGGTGGHGGHGINGSGGTGGLGEAPYLVRSAGTVIINPPLLAPPDSDTALVSVAQFVAILEALESRGDDNDVGDFTRGARLIFLTSPKRCWTKGGLQGCTTENPSVVVILHVLVWRRRHADRDTACLTVAMQRASG